MKHELRCLIEGLFYAGTLDQFNLPTLACMETLARRVQTIVDAYATAGGGVPQIGQMLAFSAAMLGQTMQSPL